MKKTLVVLAALAGLAASADASTWNVTSTNTSDTPQDTFLVGETIVLKFTGDAQGGTATGISGQFDYDAALTTFVANSQTPMFGVSGALVHGDGFSSFMDQQTGSGNPEAPLTQIQIATVSLLADAIGVSSVNLGGEGFYFFDTSIPSPTAQVHSFTIVPEPATAALIGLGVLGLVLGGRRRA